MLPRLICSWSVAGSDSVVVEDVARVVIVPRLEKMIDWDRHIKMHFICNNIFFVFLYSVILVVVCCRVVDSTTVVVVWQDEAGPTASKYAKSKKYKKHLNF